jgi:Fe-Mn family superoxide dismutase
MFILKELPYKYEELEPIISAELLELHYSKHHQAYCDNFNRAVEENNLEEKSIEEIFSKISEYSKSVENHGGGYFNHEFFWESLSPVNSEENKISDNLLKKIEENFESFENFQKEFEKKAMTLFGSG